MSDALYKDEDLPNVPSSSSSSLLPDNISTTPQDPITALSTALALPAESPEQALAFQAVSQRFEANPEKLPKLCVQLLPMVVDGGESLLRSWTLEMVGLAVGRGQLGEEIKIGGEFDMIPEE
jgi:symplekin